MINISEFYRFKQLEAKYTSAYALSHADVVLSVTLKGHLPITVYPINRGYEKKYRFMWTRFGVIKLLSDDDRLFDKSPLCEQLDEAICRNTAQTAFLSGAGVGVRVHSGEDSVLRTMQHNIRTNAIASNPTKRGLL